MIEDRVGRVYALSLSLSVYLRLGRFDRFRRKFGK